MNSTNFIDASIRRKNLWTKENSFQGLSRAGVSEKWEKLVSTSQKISCPLARINSLFENCLFLIPIMFSTSSIIALTKKTMFSLGRKSVSTSQIKDVEKSIATIHKSYCYFKKSLKKICVQWFFFRNWFFPYFNHSLRWQKRSQNKAILFSVDKKLDFTSQNEILAEIYASVGSNLWKMEKKAVFPLVGKAVFHKQE